MPLDATSSSASAHNGGLRRVGTLVARGWHAKLYAPATVAGGLRPEDVAAADRAWRAGVATPGIAPVVAGFALLCPASDAGWLAVSAFWWEAEDLHHAALLLPGNGGPPLRAPGAAERIGCVNEVLSLACEATAWRRCVLEADLPSPEAYLAECCA